MKWDKVTVLIGIGMAAVIFLLAMSFVINVKAAELPEVTEGQYQETFNEIVTRMKEMQEAGAEYKTEQMNLFEKIAYISEMFESFRSGEPDLILWVIAIGAFQVALNIALIFVVAWRH